MAATTLVHAEPLPDLPDPPATWEVEATKAGFSSGDGGEREGGRVCRCGQAHSSLTKEARKTRQNKHNNYSLLERTQI